MRIKLTKLNPEINDDSIMVSSKKVSCNNCFRVVRMQKVGIAMIIVNPTEVNAIIPRISNYRISNLA
jgi:hypothetical protein